MSRQLYAACNSPKVLFTVKGAGHGLAYLADRDGYLRTLTTFCKENNIE